MPLARRKKVQTTQDNPSILDPDADQSQPVFYLPQTGEIFLDYETYAARLTFYKMRVFQCEVTGKGGLNFFEALESERQEAKTLHSRFPEQLKAAVLRSVQWQIMGRVDHLVEAVYERFKDRYFSGERVFIDLQGEKYWARITQVFPPKKLKAKLEPGSASTSTSSLQDDEADGPIHRIEGDLKIPAVEVNKEDDPKQYIYKVQLIEEGQSAAQAQGKEPKWGGSVMDVQCSVMSRDRLAFSKSILRRFIRDYVDRDSAVASPWTVKRSIAEKYGLDVVMPEATRKGVEQVKKGEIEKRKKVWEDKLDGPPVKRVKKMSAEEKEKMEEEARLEAERLKLEKDAKERARQAALGTKRPTKYPTEDLDLKITDKEKAKGKAVTRPTLDCDLPFGGNGVFETFLMAWNFLNTFGKPLNLSTFTLDEFEHSIKHNQSDIPCALVSEVHSSLLYMCRGLTAHRHSAVISLLELKNTEMEEDGVISVDSLVDAMADYGNGWERMSLRASEGREGWEEALVGCLKDLATIANFPRLRPVLTALLFAPETEVDEESGEPIPISATLTEQAKPAERYSLLSDADKVAILGFLCDQAINNRNIHAHLEWAEAQLTELRKEKVEVNRERRRLAEEMNELGDVKDAANEATAEQEASMNDSSISDVDSEKASEAANSDISVSAGTGRSSRQRALRIKVQGAAHAKQRELARNKTASAKQALAEHRKLDEELNKQERRVDAIEREFRQLLGIVRLKSMGKDRFFNSVWWFDGLGGGTLVNGSGTTSYGTARIFIQGPNQEDWDMMERREDRDEVMERFHDEQGDTNALGVGEWGCFSQPEQYSEYVAWLNPRGNRDSALMNTLSRWQDHILAGMKKRLADVELQSRLPEARRSTRTKGGGPENRPYMLWQNRKVAAASSS